MNLNYKKKTYNKGYLKYIDNFIKICWPRKEGITYK